MAPVKLANAMSTYRNDSGFLSTLVSAAASAATTLLTAPTSEATPVLTSHKFSCLLSIRRGRSPVNPGCLGSIWWMPEKKKSTINFPPTTDEPKKEIIATQF